MISSQEPVSKSIKTHSQLVQQRRNHDQITSLMLLWWQANWKLVGAGEHIRSIQVDGAQIQELGYEGQHTVTMTW
jgi:hypothetical protein